MLAVLFVAGVARAADDADSATVYLADGTHRAAVVRSLAPAEVVLGRDAQSG